MRKKNKKKWTTPLLTVLVRDKPEETVLISCKSNFPGVTGPSLDRQNCQNVQASPGSCPWICNNYTAS